MNKAMNNTFTNLKKYLSEWPLLNLYSILIVAFLFWILFFDTNNVMVLKEINKKTEEVETQKEYYEEEIAKFKKARKDLATNINSLTNYGQNNLYIKKPNTDIYILKPKGHTQKSER